ncbi:MAG: hypothetical protein HY961_12165 [Ignavibacteriae bacterium]|nr:hypothetical protein [Ignavibacteriota bacterium]
MMKYALVILCLLPAMCLCQKKPAPKPVASMLSSYDVSGKDARVVKLPHLISEVSGIVMTEDGRLLCHDDERGVVYQIDYTNGEISKSFSLGNFGVKEDFEDIAVAGGLVYLAASNGVLFEFPEAENGRSVEFKMYKTFLTSRNDVEGLCFDAPTKSLLLLCKESPGKSYHNQRAIYAFSLRTKSLATTPRFLIPLKQVTQTSDKHEFKPSAIARHPKSGTYFVVAAHGSTIIELSADGAVVVQQSINRKVNPHPEGIAFTPDLTLILCNDGQGERGTLSMYAPKK